SYMAPRGNDIISVSCHGSNPHVARSSAAADITLHRGSLASSSSPSLSTPPRLSTLPICRTAMPSTPSAVSLTRSGVSANQPVATPSQKSKPLGLTPRAQAYSSSGIRPKFVTPFKHAMRPNQPEGETTSRPSPSRMQLQPRNEDKDKCQRLIPRPAIVKVQ